ncbi:hypothetical protein F2Q70_00023399 [Brassica cretica]|uniref:Uncharacterized protein n=1 Tax=Brassica cretica TaxID=69181 RepID=A0A8S9GXY7_BRACR|nr:hypothetical protein F2Q70_00023399 [Brassica cretica]
MNHDSTLVTSSHVLDIPFVRDVQVTNAFDASLIQFDPELPETLALKLRVSNDEFALALTDAKKQKRLTKDHTVH